MSTAIEANIIEKLQRLSEHLQVEVLEFVEHLATQKHPQAFDPMQYSGTVQWPVDGMAYQKSVRKEWE